MKQAPSTIISNTPVANGLYRLEFTWDSGPASPGQFLTLRIPESRDPLLRRPFAFSGISPEKGCAEIVYQRRGITTTTLAGLTEGDKIDLIGPLGNTFPDPIGEEVILTAGGIGIGPILFLHADLKARAIRHTLVLGARSADLLVKTTDEAQYCTDDGSLGYTGTVVDYLNTLAHRNGTVYACGPQIMMQTVNAWSAERGMQCWVSMEQIMACGVGACMGCVIEVNDRPSGYARVCKEGPVFDGKVIKWN